MTLDWLLLKMETGGDGVSASRPIGIANLVDIQFGHRRAEFLIGIPDPTDRSASAGLEATLLVMDFAFNRVGLNKLTTFVYGDNQVSQNNTLALGFTQESHLREHLALPDSGRLIDLYGNGMTVSDFRSNTRLARSSRRLLGRDITLQS
jgi:diamine N-acetyltransferase